MRWGQYSAVAEGIDAVLGQAGSGIGNRRLFCCTGQAQLKYYSSLGVRVFVKTSTIGEGSKI